MNTNELMDIKNLYRLPYSKNDNPNGWIELTTYCNMACKGCYKGIDRNDIERKHEPLEKIKADILELKRIRNCQIITISGGEALLHPDLLEILAFVKSNGMCPVIHTNGILINENNLVELKQYGLGGLIIRIDTLNRNASSEAELNSMRQHYADLIGKIRGLQLGFTCVITKQNIQQIPEVINWFQSNHDKADYLVLILKRDFLFHEADTIDTGEWAYLDELVEAIHKELPNLRYASYLGSATENIGLKWFQSAWISHNGRILAYADKKCVELYNILWHFRHDNYSYVHYPDRNYISFFLMLGGSLLVKSLRKAILAYLKGGLIKPTGIFKTPNVQSINIVNPPGDKAGNRDFCDACPDAILHDGILKPSCALEEIIRFGSIKPRI